MSYCIYFCFFSSCVGSCLAHHHHHNHHHPITNITQCTLTYITPTYITTATIMAVVRVANVIVVGVIYLSISLAVGMVVVVVLVDMGGRSGCCWVFFTMVA